MKVKGQITLSPKAPGNVIENSIFLDEDDSVLKVKDNNNVVNNLISSTPNIPRINFEVNNVMITDTDFMMWDIPEIVFKIPIVASLNDTIKKISVNVDAIAFNKGNGNDQNIVLEYSLNDSNWFALGDVNTGTETTSGIYLLMSASGQKVDFNDQIVYIRLRRYSVGAPASAGGINIKSIDINYITNENKNNIIQITKKIAPYMFNTTLALSSSPIRKISGAGTLSNAMPLRLSAPIGYRIIAASMFGTFTQLGLANSITQVYSAKLSIDGGAYALFNSYSNDAKQTSSGQTRCGKFWGYSVGLNCQTVDFAFDVTVGYFSITNFAEFCVCYYEKI